MILDVLFLHVLIVIIGSCFYYHKRREKVEATCIKESRIKTYFDEFLTNYLITLPVVLAVLIINFVAGAW